MPHQGLARRTPRAVAAATVPFPKPEDSAYYVGVARNLVEGRGIVSDALWSYATPPLVFPRPAFEVWLPLPSFLFAIPLLLSGASAPIPLETAMRAAQAIAVPLGALLAVLAWRLAADVAQERGLGVGRARTLAIGTGLDRARGDRDRRLVIAPDRPVDPHRADRSAAG